MSRSRIASEALKWVVWMQTSQSIDRYLPDFEKWLTADREHWVAYLQAQQQWSRWDHLALLLAQRPRAVASKVAALEQKRLAARAHRQSLWIALGLSVLALLVV